MNLNDPVVRLVITVIVIGVGILFLTFLPLGIFAGLALIGIIYYFFKKKNP